MELKIMEDLPEDTILMTGYEDCIAGLVEQFGRPIIVAYDTDKVLKKLESDGMTPDEAVEYMQFNMVGAYLGEGTPCFISLADDGD